MCQGHVGRVKNLMMWFALPSVQTLTFMLFSSLTANDIAKREVEKLVL